MSVIYRHADLFTSQAAALVNPVNCVGIMGRGLALAFSRRYPEILGPYRAACRSGNLRPGRVMLHELAQRRPSDPLYVIHFPTKRHWRDASRIEDIRAGLTDLAARCEVASIQSIAVPALGCGLGGLPWTTVSALIERTFAPTDAIECELHPPASARPPSRKDHPMNDVTFKRMSPGESRIYYEGDHVGDVYRQADILEPGSHYYVIHLDEDYRGPVRVHDQSRIREAATQLILTHPLWH